MVADCDTPVMATTLMYAHTYERIIGLSCVVIP